MRNVKVPIDMSSEQKEILGILSKRQLVYLVVGGIILYSYVPLVYKILSGAGWIVAGLSAITSAVPLLSIVFILGFLKGKNDMPMDTYLWIRMKRKTQYGSWRKGR